MLARSDGVSPMTLPRNKKELTEAVYRTLPPSLVQPCVVRSKVSLASLSNYARRFSFSFSILLRLKIQLFCWRDNNCSRARAFMSFLK